MTRIGEFLVSEGVLSEDAVSRALALQRLGTGGVRLGSVLLKWDLLTEDSLLAALSKIHRCPAVSGDILFDADIQTVRLLPAEHALRLDAIPYEAKEGVLRVAFVNPSNLAAIDEVSVITARRVLPAVTTEIRLLQAHQRFYGRHIPAEPRTILKKLERKTRAPEPAGESASPSPPPRASSQPRRAVTMAAAPEAIPICVPATPELADQDTVGSSPGITPIYIPELPLPAKPQPHQPPPGNPSDSSSDTDSLPASVRGALAVLTLEQGPSPTNKPPTMSRAALGSVLLEWDLLAEESLLEALSKQHHCPWVSGGTLLGADIEAVRLLPPEHAMRLSAFPYAVDGGALRVVFADPSNLTAIDEVSTITARRVLPAVTTEVRLLQAHQRFYGRHLSAELRAILQNLDRQPPVHQPTAASPGGEPTLASPGTTSAAVRIPIEPSSADRNGVASSSRVSPAAIPIPESEEEPLTTWVGDALATAQREAQAAARPVEPAGQTAPATRSEGTKKAIVDPPWLDWSGEIGDALLRKSLTDIPRVILLGVGKTLFIGWKGRGPGLSPEQIATIRLSASEPSIFTLVAQSGAPHFGPLETGQWPRTFRVLFGPKLPDCAVFPIRVLDRLTAFLYADRLGEPMPYEDFAVIARAAAATASALSRLLREARPQG